MDIADVPRAGAETFHATFDVISASGRLVTTSLVGCNVRHFEKKMRKHSILQAPLSIIFVFVIITYISRNCL